MKNLPKYIDNAPIDTVVRFIENLSAFGIDIGFDGNSGNEIRKPIASKLDLSDFHALEERLLKENTAITIITAGSLWATYASWHLKGDEKTPYLKKSVAYYEAAEAITTLAQPEGIEARRRLARILIDRLAVRNLDRGISLMEELFSLNKSYTPTYATYLQGLNLAKRYREAVNRANEIIAHSPSGVAPGLHKIKAVSLRAIIRQSKKDGALDAALSASCELLSNEYSTPNDEKVNRNLRALLRK